MKKILLLTAAMAASSFAMAQLVDITPEGYDFSKSQIGLSVYPDESAWNDWNVAAGKCFDNAGGQAAYNQHKGLIVAIGPDWKQPQTEQANWNNLNASMSYVNLGGEVGRVLCIYGNGQDPEWDFNTVYNSNLPMAEGGTSSGNLNFFMDPNNTPKAASGQGDIAAMPEHIRVRIVMNVYDADASTDSYWGNIYCVNNDGSQNPKGANGELPSDAAGRAIGCDEFFDADSYEWNADQWLVYEFDTFCPADADGTVYSPLRLKMELTGKTLAHCVCFIKEIKFFQSTDKDDLIPACDGRKRSFITLKPDLDHITGDDSAVETVKSILNRNKAYDLSGRNANANQKGLYITDGKKVLVK